MHIQGDCSFEVINMTVISVQVTWPKRTRDTAAVVQLSYFECNFEKMKKWDLTLKVGSFFSSDSELTSISGKGNKYQSLTHKDTHIIGKSTVCVLRVILRKKDVFDEDELYI